MVNIVPVFDLKSVKKKQPRPHRCAETLEIAALVSVSVFSGSENPLVPVISGLFVASFSHSGKMYVHNQWNLRRSMFQPVSFFSCFIYCFLFFSCMARSDLQNSRLEKVRKDTGVPPQTAHSAALYEPYPAGQILSPHM